MDLGSFKNMNEAYRSLASVLLGHGVKVGNTKELNNVMFHLEDPTKCIAEDRKMSYSYLIAEHIWYLMGINRVDFISRFASLWAHITDDGVTNNSAYGYILKVKFGFDQIATVTQLLREDKNSRRAVINLNTPNANVITTKDEPCTIALQFLIRNDRLDCTAMMRSSDIWFGIPYDVAYFTTLQRLIAANLGIEVGTYTHFSGSLHVYERDLEALADVFTNVEAEVSFDVKRMLFFCQDLYRSIYDNWDLSNKELKRMLLDEALKYKIITGGSF